MTEQRTLFEPLDLVEVPRARRTDPSTSVDAAREAKGLAAVHVRIILAALRHGPATAEQIAEQRLGGSLSALQTMKRLSDVLKAGLVEVQDEEGRTHAGRRCRRYRLAADDREARR